MTTRETLADEIENLIRNYHVALTDRLLAKLVVAHASEITVALRLASSHSGETSAILAEIKRQVDARLGIDREISVTLLDKHWEELLGLVVGASSSGVPLDRAVMAAHIKEMHEVVIPKIEEDIRENSRRAAELRSPSREAQGGGDGLADPSPPTSAVEPDGGKEQGEDAFAKDLRNFAEKETAGGSITKRKLYDAADTITRLRQERDEARSRVDELEPEVQQQAARVKVLSDALEQIDALAQEAISTASWGKGFDPHEVSEIASRALSPSPSAPRREENV